MKKIFVVAALAAAIPALAQTSYTGYCREAHAKMHEDDYHRVKRLMPKHDAVISREGQVYLDFGSMNYPQTEILQQRLQRYGGLKCVNTAEWYAAHQHVVTHKVGNKGYIDCVITDFGDKIPEQAYPQVICLPLRTQ